MERRRKAAGGLASSASHLPPPLSSSAAARLATLVTTLSAPPPSEAAEAPPGPCSALEEVFGNSADTPCPCPLTLADAGAGFCSAAPRPDHQHPLLASEAVAAASEAGRRAAAARALHATALSTLADLVTAWRSDRAAAADARVQALRAGDSDAYLRLATARGGAGALPRSTRGLLAATDACLRTLAERLGVALPLPHDPAAGEAAGVAVAAAAWDEIVAAGAPTDVAPPPGLTGGELRPHQTAGVRWLVSLQRRGLHGILADDVSVWGGWVGGGKGRQKHESAFAFHTLSHFPTKHTRKPYRWALAKQCKPSPPSCTASRPRPRRSRRPPLPPSSSPLRPCWKPGAWKSSAGHPHSPWPCTAAPNPTATWCGGRSSRGARAAARACACPSSSPRSSMHPPPPMPPAWRTVSGGGSWWMKPTG